MGMGTNGSLRQMERISTELQVAVLLGLSLRIKFVLNQDQG
jgi:hypothetical protein